MNAGLNICVGKGTGIAGDVEIVRGAELDGTGVVVDFPFFPPLSAHRGIQKIQSFMKGNLTAAEILKTELAHTKN